MVWRTIGLGFRTALVKCTKCVNAWEYQQVLEESDVLQIANQMYAEKAWSFMLSGHPEEATEETRLAARRRRIHCILGSLEYD